MVQEFRGGKDASRPNKSNICSRVDFVTSNRQLLGVYLEPDPVEAPDFTSTKPTVRICR